MYAGLADDTAGKVLCSVSDITKTKAKTKSTKQDKSEAVGKNIAKKALEKGIKKVVFDRGGYVYHGRVKKVAEGARSSGLVF